MGQKRKLLCYIEKEERTFLGHVIHKRELEDFALVVESQENVQGVPSVFYQ